MQRDRISNIILNDRLNDQELANFIRRDSGSERSAIFYGTWHGRGNNDLDEMLAGPDGRTPRRIELHGDGTVRNTQDYRNEAGPDRPEIIYTIREGTALLTQAADPELRQSLGVTPAQSVTAPAPVIPAAVTAPMPTIPRMGR